MASTITIRRQIRSITSTKKVTKAMELVAASKMRKSVVAALASRPYVMAAESALQKLVVQGGLGDTHPLLVQRAVKKIAVIAIGSNRGLCGGFNTVLATQTFRFLQERYPGIAVEYLTLGRRLRDTLARQGGVIAADFIKQDVTRSAADILPVVRAVLDGYTDGKYDAVVLCHTEYVSAMKQVPVVKLLVPCVPEMSAGSEVKGTASNFLFEPSPEQVLTQLVPRLLEAQIFQAVLESEASEHSARMVAMRSATDAAKDLLMDLNLSFNRIRQSAITQEIA